MRLLNVTIMILVHRLVLDLWLDMDLLIDLHRVFSLWHDFLSCFTLPQLLLGRVPTGNILLGRHERVIASASFNRHIVQALWRRRILTQRHLLYKALLTGQGGRLSLRVELHLVFRHSMVAGISVDVLSNALRALAATCRTRHVILCVFGDPELCHLGEERRLLR